MKKLKISIIIPVYNIEIYINECVESILNQTFQNYEVILVDDGSTDNSGRICDELSDKHTNIKVIHKNNGGLSSARNAGIRDASGEYLMFVDGDDFLIDNECLEKIEKNLGNYDILQYKMKYFYQKNNKFLDLKNICDITKEKTSQEKIYKLICNGCLSISACDKILAREYILKYNLFFEENLISEDVHWSLHIYEKNPTINIINIPIYGYRKQRENSITNNCNKKSIESQLKIIEYWYNHNYMNVQLKQIYYAYLAYLYLILITQCGNEYKDEIIKYKELLKYNGNYKVKLANKIKSIVGFKIMIKILKIYMKLTKKGIIKI